MIILNKLDAKSQAVLCIIADLDHDFLRKCYVEPYLNGREQGFAITSLLNQKKVVWSENRNSDDFVVYADKSYAFSMQGNTPTEEIWEKRKYFAYDEYLAVAKYVLEELRKGETNDK